MKLLLTLCLAGLLAACAQKPPPQLSGAAETDVGFAVATLAPLGSYEMKLAPGYTRIAVIAHQLDKALKAGSITKDQAQSAHDAAQHVKMLLDQALSACGEDQRTGQCMKQQADADALLAQAQTELANL